MSLRLRLLSALTPNRLLIAELAMVREATVGALDSIIEENCPVPISDKKFSSEGKGLEDMRREMAHTQERRVNMIVECMGKEKAIELSRARLFDVGVRLGEEARGRLGVGQSLEDMLLAARILYRVLGIEFSFTPHGEGGTLFIHRCALSQYYSSTTCRVLSAVDEGVVTGLNPQLRMRFEETITNGRERCVAKIIINGER